MADVTLQFPQADVDKLFAQIQRAQVELNKESKKAISWAGASLCDSLRASTKKAPKYRKILKATAHRLGAENPTKGERELMKEESKAAPYGVYVYQKGKRVFRRIRMIDKDVITFRSKTTGKMLGRKKGSDEVHSIERFVNKSKADLKNHPLVTIFYSGLAKKAWSIAKAKVVSGGYGFDMRVKKAIVSVNWIGGVFNPAVKIADKLSYAMDAFKTDGAQAVNSAFQRAADSLEKKISDAIKTAIKKQVA